MEDPKVNRYDVAIQLGSQVQYSHTGYVLAPHTRMRTMAAAIALKTGVANRLIVAGGSNFGVRYDDKLVFGPGHPTQKKAVFTFEAFAYSDWQRKAESTIIKDFLVNEFGVNPALVLAETLSSTTEENAKFI